MEWSSKFKAKVAEAVQPEAVACAERLKNAAAPLRKATSDFNNKCDNMVANEFKVLDSKAGEVLTREMESLAAMGVDHASEPAVAELQACSDQAMSKTIYWGCLHALERENIAHSVKGKHARDHLRSIYEVYLKEDKQKAISIVGQEDYDNILYVLAKDAPADDSSGCDEDEEEGKVDDVEPKGGKRPAKSAKSSQAARPGKKRKQVA